jgi:putative membrane protein
MSDLKDPRVFFAAERTLMAWTRTGLTLMAFGFMLERFGLFLHMLRKIPGHIGRDLSFWIGIAFITLAILVISYSVVQYRRVMQTMNPVEIPENYSTWAGIAMNVAVVALGIALVAYLFSEF